MYCFVMFFASYVSFVSVKCLLIQYHQAASRNKSRNSPKFPPEFVLTKITYNCSFFSLSKPIKQHFRLPFLTTTYAELA